MILGYGIRAVLDACLKQAAFVLLALVGARFSACHALAWVVSPALRARATSAPRFGRTAFLDYVLALVCARTCCAVIFGSFL